jgi:hypothetical protein
MMDTRTRITTTAAGLRPGDIVIDPDTDEREHAVYDAAARDGRVILWTAVTDQEFGWPEKFTVDATTPYTITRKN